MYLGSIWYHLPKTTLFNNVAAVRSLKTVKSTPCPLVTLSTMAGRGPKSSAADEIEQKEFDGVVYRIGDAMLGGQRRSLKDLFLPVTVGSLLAASAFSPATRTIIGKGLGAVMVGVSGYFVLHCNIPKLRDAVLAKVMPGTFQDMDKKMKRVKKELLKSLEGRVLDVGAGTGSYIKYSRSLPVAEYVALEPYAYLIPSLKKNAEKSKAEALANKESHPEVTVLNQTLEMLPSDQNGTFDCVIFGNVMCEIKDCPAALAHVRRLLKPGGKLYFIEHVLDDQNPFRSALQHMINPLWRSFSDGCNCNRRSLDSIRTQFPNVMCFTLGTAGIAHLRPFIVGIAKA